MAGDLDIELVDSIFISIPERLAATPAVQRSANEDLVTGRIEAPRVHLHIHVDLEEQLGIGSTHRIIKKNGVEDQLTKAIAVLVRLCPGDGIAPVGDSVLPATKAALSAVDIELVLRYDYATLQF